MLRKFAIGLLATALGISATASAQSATPTDTKRYQPTIDITKDPQCGRKLATPDERIAHNRKLAELYFINFQKDRENGRNWGWWTWNCMAPEATIMLGALDALATPMATKDFPARDPNALTGEQRGYFATFPDWRTQPGTLAVFPFDGGVFFRMLYAGHAKDDGKLYTIWESNLILVNDQGQITHFEMWNDTIGMDASTRKAFGVGIDKLGGKGYHEATEAYPK